MCSDDTSHPEIGMARRCQVLVQKSMETQNFFCYSFISAEGPALVVANFLPRLKTPCLLHPLMVIGSNLDLLL